MADTNYDVLEYGDHKVVIADMPPTSRYALMRQAFGHKLGNEAASAVTAKINAALGDAAKTTDLTEWRAANKAMVDQWTTEARDGIVAKIMAGTLGVREGGPRKDPVDRKFDELVVRYIVAQLKAIGLKLPKSDDDVITFKNGATRTRSAMIANVKASQGDKLRAEAERLVKEEQRLADRAARDVGKQEEFDPSSAGL